MSLIHKVGVGLSSVTGISTAVTVPLSLNNGKGIEVSVLEDISKCGDTTGGDIDFGDKSAKKVCGKVEGVAETTNSKLAEDQKYTQLFKEMGNNPRDTGSSESEYGKTHCDNSKGIFNGQGVGSESLGLCDNTQSNQQGIMIQNQDKTTVEVCAGDCFKVESTTSTYKTFNASSKEGSGQKIQFKKLD